MLYTLEPMAAWYLFFLGLAVGLTFLAMSAYLSVSPAWLRWSLLLSGLFVESRYLTMAAFAISPDPQAMWGLRRCWFATAVGLTLPSVVALDQLVRHPAMSPKKLMRLFAPFLLVYGLVIGLGEYRLRPDEVIGVRPTLVGVWQVLLAITQTAFLVGFLGIGMRLIKKLPIVRIRVALLGLMAAHLYLGLDGFLRTVGWWYFRPFLFSEMLTLLAIWFALQVARTEAL